MFEDLTQQEALDCIVRAAMKHEYDKGGSITNARAFADSVTRRALDNEAAIPGSLRLAYNAAAKQLRTDEPVVVNPAAYQPWTPIADDYEACSPEERAEWIRLVQSKLAGLDLSLDRPPLVLAGIDEPPPLDDDDIPGYGDQT